MFKLIIATILNTFTLTSQCDINNTINKEELNNTIQLPKSTFRIVNDCNKQRDFYYRESYNNDKLFILDQFKWKDFNYINDFVKNNGVVFRYGKQSDATLFEANYDTFPIGNSKDGIFYDISVIPPDCGYENWGLCKGNKLGYNVPIKVEVVDDLKNKGVNCLNLECDNPQCKMGMKWPSDNINVYACPGSVSFIIKFEC